MPGSNRRRRLALLAGGAVAICAILGLLVLRRLDRAVREAANPDRVRAERVRPLSFRPLPHPGSWRSVDVSGDASVASLASVDGALWEAGGRGLSDGTQRLDTRSGLPTLRLRAVTGWRGMVVFAAERTGWGRLGQVGPEEATSGWGPLEVRALVETEGGELLVGARQGLFRAAFGAGELERLDAESVRAIALLPAGEIAAGGEKGIRIVSVAGASARRVATPDPWIEDLGYDAVAGILWAATPLGVASGPASGPEPSLSLHPRGGDATGGVLQGGRWFLIPIGEKGRVAAIAADGSRTEETTPESFTRLFAAGGELLAASPQGIWRRDGSQGWVRVRVSPPGALPRQHVNALAAEGPSLWAGFFDGGLAKATVGSDGLEWKALAASEAWGVNALLTSGRTVWAATLRGLVRLDGGRLVGADERRNPGAAFSLAATRTGLAVGYGQGVLLPEKRLLSAFHGLPGNQAYALASSKSTSSNRLWVGTPTGLGCIEGTRIVARVTSGEGKLPHPWITALIEQADGSLLVATNGGGVARRTAGGSTERWDRFPETAGLKVNAGAMVVDPAGRIWIGTLGQGIWRTDRGGRRFVRAELPLPSPDVFSLALFPADAPESLYVGTDEGLARVFLDANAHEEAR